MTLRIRRIPHGALALAVASTLSLPVLAQTVDGTVTNSVSGEAAPTTNLAPGREGAAAAESVEITLASQATEIRQILMEGGEVNADGLEATERAREIASQAVEATGILGNPGDTMVTTTRMSDMDAASELFRTIEAALAARIAAIRAGDEGEANRMRLAALDAINELPESIRFEGEAAQGDNPTAAPGGAQPVLQQ